jgi:hypothetical protein
MKDELSSKLYAKYPKLFSQKDLPASETCMCWGITCGDGWFGIIDEACEKLQKLADESNSIIEFTQVKEKFGGLRLYLSIDQNKETRIDIMTNHGILVHSANPIDDIWGEAHIITNEAEEKSVKTCELCGKEATQISRGGWISTLCEEHGKEKEEA